MSSAWPGRAGGDASAAHTVTDFHHAWAAEALAGLVACLAIAVTARSAAART